MSAVAASYEDALRSLNALIPELFSAPGMARRKFSLDEIGVLSHGLGDPHLRFRPVLVAGTNGKGSTAASLASIGSASGLRVGLYTSPHLERVNERIRLDGEPIADEDFARLYFRVESAALELVRTGKLPGFPSYFELLTALGFLYFAEAKVDLAVLEVGMGGRLDATNLVEPMLSIVTDISLDHQEWLGETIDLIAREKAGILRRDGTLVTLPQHPEANQALGEIAVALNVKGISAAEYMPATMADPEGAYELELPELGVGQAGVSGGSRKAIRVDSPLRGSHQHRNIALAIAAAVELAEGHGFPITGESIAQGIRRTSWPGRLERIWLAAGEAEWGQERLGQEFVLDVAHNPAGAWALRAALTRMEKGGSGGEEAGSAGQVLIFACLRDKPLREMTQILFPIFERVVLAPIQSPRANEVADLMAAAEATGVAHVAAGSAAEAVAIAQESTGGRIVISGSVYLVGEARRLLMEAGAQQGGLRAGEWRL